MDRIRDAPDPLRRRDGPRAGACLTRRGMVAGGAAAHPGGGPRRSCRGGRRHLFCRVVPARISTARLRPAGAAVTTPQLGRFIELLTREQFSLAEACLLIAQDAYPELNVEAYLHRIEAIAEGVRSRIPADAFAEQRIVALNNYLFGELRISGNAADYYDPRNSYLNEVIDRCTGIPITLSVLYMEVGQRVGLALKGVSFPGHFLVKLRVKRGQLVIDPFSRGEPQSEDDLRKRLQHVLPRNQTVESIDPYIE